MANYLNKRRQARMQNWARFELSQNRRSYAAWATPVKLDTVNNSLQGV